jgi:CubicO group peptidase (beta-lactamase class C family)
LGAPSIPEIHGFCDERFTPVRRALADNFRERGELGCAVAVMVEGVPVVDIWAGWADAARTRRWERDTQVAVFSVGKAMATVCLLMLAERGAIDLDAAVSGYWPAFASGGKGDTTVRMVLAHRAGLPALRRSLPPDAPYDWELMTSALAEEEPWWEPGSMHGYHVNTFGFVVGELVRRACGESIGAFFRREVAEPLAADFHFGFGPEHDARTAEFIFSTTSYESAEGVEERRPTDVGEDRRFLLGRVYLA